MRDFQKTIPVDEFCEDYREYSLFRVGDRYAIGQRVYVASWGIDPPIKHNEVIPVAGWFDSDDIHCLMYSDDDDIYWFYFIGRVGDSWALYSDSGKHLGNFASAEEAEWSLDPSVDDLEIDAELKRDRQLGERWSDPDQEPEPISVGEYDPPNCVSYKMDDPQYMEIAEKIEALNEGEKDGYWVEDTIRWPIYYVGVLLLPIAKEPVPMGMEHLDYWTEYQSRVDEEWWPPYELEMEWPKQADEEPTEREPEPIGLDMVDAELRWDRELGSRADPDQEPEPMGVYDEWDEPTECDDWSSIINLCYNNLAITGPPDQLAEFKRRSGINEDMIDANDDAWDDRYFDANQNYNNHKDFIDFIRTETDTHVERIRLYRSEDGGLEICMDSWRLHVASSVHWMAKNFPSLAFDLQTYGDRSAPWDQVLFKDGKWIFFFHESFPPSEDQSSIGTVAAAGHDDDYSNDFEQLRKNFDIDSLDDDLRAFVEEHKNHADDHGLLGVLEFHNQAEQLRVPDYRSQLE